MVTTNGSKQVEALETVRKKRAALESRLRKVPYREIAEQHGVSIDCIRAWVKEMTVTMLPQEEAEELRAQEVAGYDRSEQDLLGCIEMAKREGIKREEEGLGTTVQQDAIARYNDQLSSIRKARAVLLGLNMPVMVKHNLIVRTEFDAEVESLTSLLLGGGNLMSLPEDVDTGEENNATS